MAQEPKNPRLWAMYIAQAKAHFNVWPSPAASHWVHEHYTKAGGQFIETTKESRAKETATKAAHDKVTKRSSKGKPKDEDDK